MAWSWEGTYFESCSRDAVCPCTWSGSTAKAMGIEFGREGQSGFAAPFTWAA